MKEKVMAQAGDVAELRRLALMLLMTDNAGKCVFPGISSKDKALLHGNDDVKPFAPTPEKIKDYQAETGVVLPCNALVLNYALDEKWSLPFILHPWIMADDIPLSEKQAARLSVHEQRQIFPNGVRKLQLVGKAIHTDDLMQEHNVDLRNLNPTVREHLVENTFGNLIKGPQSFLHAVCEEYGIGRHLFPVGIQVEKGGQVIIRVAEPRIVYPLLKPAIIPKPESFVPLPWMEP